MPNSVLLLLNDEPESTESINVSENFELQRQTSSTNSKAVNRDVSTTEQPNELLIRVLCTSRINNSVFLA